MHKQKVTTKLGSRKSIFPKVTKMGSIFGHKIDYYGVGVLRGQRHIPVRSNFNPSKGWFSYAAKLKCLWHSRRYCLRYYSDIWEDNAAGRKKHRRSWAPSCLRSRTRVQNFTGMTAVKTCDGFCCRRLVFSYRNGIADSTGRRVGVISQVAPRHMRTGLNARSPPPPPREGFPASGETPVTEVALYQVCELVLGRPTGAWHNKHSIKIRRELNLDRLLFPSPGTTMLSWFCGV